MQKVREKLAADFPMSPTYFQSGGLVDSVVNQGKPAPIDIQVSSNNMDGSLCLAQSTAEKMRGLPSVSDVLIPQDIDYPGLALNIDRVKQAVGPDAQDIVDNVITAMTSNGMVAPSSGSIRRPATTTCSRCNTPRRRLKR